MIKNIVFDLGGVLVGLNAAQCIHAFERINCHDIALYVADHRTEDLFKDIETGTITTQEFCNEVRAITLSSASDTQIINAWTALLTEISDERQHRLQQLSRKYRTFLLSNTNDMHWKKCAEELFLTTGDDTVKCFEQVFLSYKMGLAKPSYDIFNAVLQQAGILPHETLFIDDSAVNCKAADELGFMTFQNKSIDDWLSLEL